MCKARTPESQNIKLGPQARTKHDGGVYARQYERQKEKSGATDLASVLCAKSPTAADALRPSHGTSQGHSPLAPHKR